MSLSSVQEEERRQLAQVQRALAQKWERAEASLQKRLTTMVERIRHFRGTPPEATWLQAEQRQMERLLERLEVATSETVDLLHEWRDWMRALRQGLPLDAKRVELVGSELRLRGVIGDDQDHRPMQTRDRVAMGEGMVDSFSEWDQYVGKRLPEASAFWQRRIDEMETEGAHQAVLHGLAKQMKHAHGQARVWRRLQK